MRKSRFSDQQISLALQQTEYGLPVAEFCRKLGISDQTFYRFGGPGSMVRLATPGPLI